MFLTKENLAVHLIASNDPARLALSGILVDPKRNVTAASDGRRLVEITAPSIDPETYPSSGVKLANGEAKPFILPAQTAQEIAKILPKGRNESDPIRCAALAMGKDGKLSIVTTDGKKNYSFSFDPIDATFPDYEAKVFPKAKPNSSLALNPELLWKTAKVAAIGDVMTLHIYDDRVLMEAQAKDGTKSRAVLMGCEAKAESVKSKPEETKSAAAPTPVSAPKAQPVQKTGTRAEPERKPFRKFGGQRRRWTGSRHATTQATMPGEPTLAQRAFHTFLLKSRGNEITLEDLRDANALERIEDLKQSPAQEENFATWLQWKKLFFLLSEKKAKPETVCEVLSSLTDIKSTSSVIVYWLGRDPSEANAAAA